VSLQAFAPNVSDETAYVINRMLHKDPEGRYQSYEELLTHLLYARQKLQKRGAEQGGATKKAAVKPRSNKPVLTTLWSLAAVACIAVAVCFFIKRPAASGGADRVAMERASALLAEGRQALNARRLDEARTKFNAAIAATSGDQPARNWAVAHLGLAALMAGGDGHDAFARLGDEAFFDMALAPQALGKFFQSLSKQMESDGGQKWSAENYEAFGLLADGIRAWNEGSIEEGGVLIERFAKASPAPPDNWVAELKPAASAYIADYRTYIELHAAVDKFAGGDASELIARIEKAKSGAKTGAPAAAKLDALADKLRAR